jgi:putative tricarboxylic transport membrane protein
MRLIGRSTAVCLFLFAAAYGLGATAIEYAFASDPLGPRVFPAGLAVLLALLSIWYFFAPGPAEGYPSGRLLLRVLGIPLVMLAAVALFEPAGFLVSTFVLTFGTALIFGAPPVRALLGAVGQAALWWFVFSYVLEVYLPAGVLFGR